MISKSEVFSISALVLFLAVCLLTVAGCASQDSDLPWSTPPEGKSPILFPGMPRN